MTLQPGKHLVQAGGKKNRRVQLELEVLQVSRDFVVQERCLCSEVRCPCVQVLRYKCQPEGHKRELWALLRCCRVPPGMETRVNGQEKKLGSTGASGKADQASAVLALPGWLCYWLTLRDLEGKLEGKTSSPGNTD